MSNVVALKPNTTPRVMTVTQLLDSITDEPTR